jgi:hypothetical protein
MVAVDALLDSNSAWAEFIVTAGKALFAFTIGRIRKSIALSHRAPGCAPHLSCAFICRPNSANSAGFIRFCANTNS